MKSKVLVTGANGQLGKTIQELYSKNEVNLDFTFVTKKELDITDKVKVDQYFKNHLFNYCINCAAYTNVEQSEKTPEIAYKVNGEGVKNIAEACKDNDNDIVLVHISTDYVFDGEKEEPYNVYDSPNPINEYGKSKLLGEQYIKETLVNYFIIRTSWLYSKKHGKNFYKMIFEKAESEKELSITVDQTGCPTDAVNLSKYIIALIANQNDNFGVHHFCDGKAMTWYDFASKILTENNISHKVNLNKVNNYRTFAKRPKNSILQN